MYSGGVVLLCGLLFTNLKTLILAVSELIGEEIGEILNAAGDFVGGIVWGVGENAVKIGAGLLVIYMVLAVLVFVKRNILHR